MAVSGYRDCLWCTKSFPFSNGALVRGYFSRPLGMMIGKVTQQFCSRPCSLQYRNSHANPGRTERARTLSRERMLKRGTAHLNTPQTHLKQRLAILGANHWNWQGGITPENRRRRNLQEARDWRKAIFERDNYTCQICLKRGGYLQADHIKPWSLYPDLRLELSNGRTLCRDCHKQTPTYMGRMKNYLKAIHSPPTPTS